MSSSSSTCSKVRSGEQTQSLLVGNYHIAGKIGDLAIDDGVGKFNLIPAN